MNRSFGFISIGEDFRPRLSPPAGAGALLLSPQDFDVLIVDLPAKLPEQDVSSFLKFKLKGLYPGSGDDTLVLADVVRRRNQSKAVVTLLRKDVAEACREAASIPILNPPRLCLAAPGKASTLVLEGEGWWFVLTRENGLPSGVQSFYDSRALRDFLREHSDTSPLVITTNGSSRIQGQVPGTPRFLSLAEGGADWSKEVASVFGGEETRSRAAGKARLLILGGLVAVLLTLVVFRILSGLEDRVAGLRGLYLEQRDQGARVGVLRSQLAVLEEEQQRLIAARGRNPYLFLSDLYGVMGEGFRITRLTLQEDGFVLEVRGRDPLALVQKFAARQDFSDISLSRVTRVEGGSEERFVLTGVYHGH